MQQLSLRVPALLLVLGLLSVGVTAQELTEAYARDLLRQSSKLIPDMREVQQASAAANIANAQARAGDLPNALVTASLPKKSQARAEALGSVAYFIDFSGDLDGALRLVDGAATGQAKNGSYQQIAFSHANKREFSDAVRVAYLIQDEPGRLVDTLNFIANAQYKDKDSNGAEETWGAAIQIAQQTEKHPDREFALIGIATSRAESGEIASASATLNDLYRSVDPHDPANQGLLAVLANAFAQIGDSATAMRVIALLIPGSNRDISLMSLAIQFAKADDLADAEDSASRISEAGLRAHTFQSIALAETDFGRDSSALDTAEKVTDIPGRADALVHLALEQAEKQNPAAQLTLQQAVLAANAGGGAVPSYVFETIAVTDAILRDFAAAEAITNRLSTDGRVWPWWNITEMMVEAGDLAGAIDIANSEHDACAKAYALLGTANGILSMLKREAEKSHPQR
jgi:tetratricopeptide (TPR) repeat protein